MKIGIIAEFNPFHNGHIYLINKIKEIFKDPEIIVALSCDYVQRGEIACLPFEVRKNIALEYGATKVVELDFFASTQAAHIFAKKSIDLLIKEGIDYLVFGVSDTDDIKKYLNAANVIKKNFDQYNKDVRMNLKTGKSYVLSCFLSLEKLIGVENIPQDILGFEYTKYIVFNNLSVKPFCIKRTAPHNSLIANNNYASATMIRKMLEEGEDVSMFTPINIPKNFSKIEDKYIEFKQRVQNYSKEELANIALVSEGMENLFKKNIEIAKNYNEFVDLCTSKRYTNSRIKRVMLYVLLGIKKEDLC
ncbi:nucleotidyltransferase [Metamycoplasma hominis]|uniref:nucleotidyltransferase n=1 Tax=Metamycoplasma hominis TaxID=2098 RepID=UPI000DED5849|nr:nucleotidyltransferase [Metamycoplasma hominis]RCJ02294.1 hypothetical protein DSL63_02575 [Metamycoplasma hominis]